MNNIFLEGLTGALVVIWRLRYELIKAGNFYGSEKLWRVKQYLEKRQCSEAEAYFSEPAA